MYDKYLIKNYNKPKPKSNIIFGKRNVTTTTKTTTKTTTRKNEPSFKKTDTTSYKAKTHKKKKYYKTPYPHNNKRTTTIRKKHFNKKEQKQKEEGAWLNVANKYLDFEPFNFKLIGGMDRIEEKKVDDFNPISSLKTTEPNKYYIFKYDKKEFSILDSDVFKRLFYNIDTKKAFFKRTKKVKANYHPNYTYSDYLDEYIDEIIYYELYFEYKEITKKDYEVMIESYINSYFKDENKNKNFYHINILTKLYEYNSSYYENDIVVLDTILDILDIEIKKNSKGLYEKNDIVKSVCNFFINYYDKNLNEQIEKFKTTKQLEINQITKEYAYYIKYENKNRYIVKYEDYNLNYLEVFYKLKNIYLKIFNKMNDDIKIHTLGFIKDENEQNQIIQSINSINENQIEVLEYIIEMVDKKKNDNKLYYNTYIKTFEKSKNDLLKTEKYKHELQEEAQKEHNRKKQEFYKKQQQKEEQQREQEFYKKQQQQQRQKELEKQQEQLKKELEKQRAKLDIDKYTKVEEKNLEKGIYLINSKYFPNKINRIRITGIDRTSNKFNFNYVDEKGEIDSKNKENYSWGLNGHLFLLDPESPK